MNLYIDYSEFELTCWDTTMLPGNSTITMYQMTSGKPEKRPGKNFSLVFLFCL